MTPTDSRTNRIVEFLIKTFSILFEGCRCCRTPSDEQQSFIDRILVVNDYTNKGYVTDDELFHGKDFTSKALESNKFFTQSHKHNEEDFMKDGAYKNVFLMRNNLRESSTGESGYGRSIEDSLSSGILDIKVEQQTDQLDSKFKIMIQSQSRTWDFLCEITDIFELESSLRKEVDIEHEGFSRLYQVKPQDIESFLQTLTRDTRALKSSKLQKFLQLDQYRSISEWRQDPRPSVPSADNKINMDTHQIPSAVDNQKIRLSSSDFEFITLIGKGSFGRVVLSRRKDDKKYYAIKILNKNQIIRRNEIAHVMSERSVLLTILRHPYVVQLYYAFTSKTRVFFVMEYINGGELFYHLQKERHFSEARTQFYAAEICCALTYMHSKGIVYRDLKPENLLLDRYGHVVLTDFGLSKKGLESASSKTSTFCGSPEYLAPEVLQKKPYTRSVDWWTFGAVIHEMLLGFPPFYSRNKALMYERILNRPLSLKSSISFRAKNILHGLLHKDASCRLGAGPTDGEEVKAHDFFTSIDWNRVETRSLNPPFVPRVHNEYDTNNIDPTFTKEPVGISFSSVSDSSSRRESDAFSGFSYHQSMEDHNDR